MKTTDWNKKEVTGHPYEAPNLNCIVIKTSGLLCLSDTSSEGGIDNYFDDGELGE